MDKKLANKYWWLIHQFFASSYPIGWSVFFGVL